MGDESKNDLLEKILNAINSSTDVHNIERKKIYDEIENLKKDNEAFYDITSELKVMSARQQEVLEHLSKLRSEQKEECKYKHESIDETNRSLQRDFEIKLIQYQENIAIEFKGFKEIIKQVVENKKVDTENQNLKLKNMALVATVSGAVSAVSFFIANFFKKIGM